MIFPAEGIEGMVRAMITQCLEPGRKNSLETKDGEFCFVLYFAPFFGGGGVNSMLRNCTLFCPQ